MVDIIGLLERHVEFDVDIRSDAVLEIGAKILSGGAEKPWWVTELLKFGWVAVKAKSEDVYGYIRKGQKKSIPSGSQVEQTVKIGPEAGDTKDATKGNERGKPPPTG